MASTSEYGTAIILAAGLSTRMGRCKPLLPWQDRTLLSYQICQWLDVEIHPLVVLGPHNAASARPHLLNQRAVVTPSPESGKTDSIRTGLQHLPKSVAWIAISAVDQPRPSWVYRRLIESFQQRQPLITVPVHGDRMGHPVLFRSDLAEELVTLQEDRQGLRQILRTFSSTVHPVPFSDPLVLSDLNTPEHYAEEQRRWGIHASG